MTLNNSVAVVHSAEKEKDSVKDWNLWLWLFAICGWSVAGLQFFVSLVPLVYWFVVHVFAAHTVVSIVTGNTKILWPTMENFKNLNIIQSLINLIQNKQWTNYITQNTAKSTTPEG